MMLAKVVNVFLSPVWILKTERIFYDNLYYIKVHFFANEDNLDIKELCFKINYEDKSVIIKSNNFIRAESYPLDIVFGCSLSLPLDYKEGSFSINLIGVYINNTAIDFSQYENGHVFIDVYKPNEKKKFLRDTIRSYHQFPSIGETYWQCFCGQHNSNENEYCSGCNCNQNVIREIFENGIDSLIVKRYLSLDILEYKPMHTFEDIYPEYIKSIMDRFNISEELIIEQINYDELKNKYNNLEEEYYKNISKNKEKLIKEFKYKAKLTLIGFIGMTLLILLLFFVPKIYNYGNGLIKLSEHKYSSALQYFVQNDTFLNSEKMVDEVYYQWAISLENSKISKSINLLESMSNLNYRNSRNLYNKYVEKYGRILFESKLFNEAADYFSRSTTKYSNEQESESMYLYVTTQKINIYDKEIVSNLEKLIVLEYKDSKELYNIAFYDEALKLIENKDFEKAIITLENIKYYKDAQTLLWDTNFNYGVLLVQSGKFEDSLKYFTKSLAKSETQFWLNEASYQLAMNEYTNGYWYNALKKFRKIIGFKDVNQKIVEIEDKLNPWEIKISFTNNLKSLDNLEKISIEDPVYLIFSFTTRNQNAHITPMFHFVLPDGTTNDTTFEDSIYPEESYSIYWENGLYDDPENGSKGLLYVKVYNKDNGILIGTDTVEIIE